MKKIKLTQNRFATVSSEDYDFLNQFNWSYHSRGYAVSTRDEALTVRQQAFGNYWANI